MFFSIHAPGRHRINLAPDKQFFYPNIPTCKIMCAVVFNDYDNFLMNG